MRNHEAQTKPAGGASVLADGLGGTQSPFGYYDHFNDVMYRGPLGWVEAEKAIAGGNDVTTVFDMSSAECLLAKRVAEINRLREIEEAAINVCKVKGRHHSEIAMRRLMEVCGFVTPN